MDFKMERGWTGSVCPLFQRKKSVLFLFYNLSFPYKVYFLQSILFSFFNFTSENLYLQAFLFYNFTTTISNSTANIYNFYILSTISYIYTAASILTMISLCNYMASCLVYINLSFEFSQKQVYNNHTYFISLIYKQRILH